MMFPMWEGYDVPTNAGGVAEVNAQQRGRGSWGVMFQ